MPDKQAAIATIQRHRATLEASEGLPWNSTRVAAVETLLALIDLLPFDIPSELISGQNGTVCMTAGPLEEPQKPFVVLSQQTGCEGL
jgi:hypothetical protein